MSIRSYISRMGKEYAKPRMKTRRQLWRNLKLMIAFPVLLLATTCTASTAQESAFSIMGGIGILILQIAHFLYALLSMRLRRLEEREEERGDI